MKATESPSSNKESSTDAQEAKQASPTPTIIAQETLQLGKKLGVLIIGDETLCEKSSKEGSNVDSDVSEGFPIGSSNLCAIKCLE